MDEKKQSKTSIILDAVCGILMILCTLVYLMIGFIAHIWHPTWVIFVAGGIVCAIIGIIKDTVEKLKSQDDQNKMD